VSRGTRTFPTDKRTLECDGPTCDNFCLEFDKPYEQGWIWVNEGHQNVGDFCSFPCVAKWAGGL
jgi:hypothetical protein